MKDSIVEKYPLTLSIIFIITFILVVVFGLGSIDSSFNMAEQFKNLLNIILKL